MVGGDKLSAKTEFTATVLELISVWISVAFAHPPSPLQNVAFDAPFPPFKFATGKFPVTSVANDTWLQAASPRQKVVEEALVPLLRLVTGILPIAVKRSPLVAAVGAAVLPAPFSIPVGKVI